MEICYYLEDLEVKQLIFEIYEEIAFKCAKYGLSKNHEFIDLGIQALVEGVKITYPDWNLNNIYILLPIDSKVSIRKIKQRKGGYLYSIDPTVNPDCVVFYTGGKYQENVVIAGKFVCYPSKFSKEICKRLKSKLKKISNLKKGWYVSKELSNRNFRLTTNANSPLEYDLKIS